MKYSILLVFYLYFTAIKTGTSGIHREKLMLSRMRVRHREIYGSMEEMTREEYGT